MGLNGGFLRRHYKITIVCDNCGAKSTLRVPKGISVSEFIKGKMARCNECGCITKPEEYQTEWIK